MSQSDRDRDELYQQITNDRTKALRAERTIGDADRVDDPRTAIRYVGEDKGVDQFQVAFTKTRGFPLGKINRSIQPENHIRDWIEQNEVEIIDTADEPMFETTDYDDGEVGAQLVTDGGMLSEDEAPNRVQEFTRDHGLEDGEADFAFICPRCKEKNPLKGDPMDFANKPFRCPECNYVPLLGAEELEEFADD